MLWYKLFRLWLNPNRVSFISYSRQKMFRDNSTHAHPWNHPPRHPYQVYGLPLGGSEEDEDYDNRRQVWTNATKLPGYRFAEDYFSDRAYHVREGS